MEAKDYLKDISEIRDMMDKSSQFISLSGLSGILAGIYALIGAYIANGILSAYNPINNTARGTYNPGEHELTLKLLTIALVVVVTSIITGILMSMRKAEKKNEKVWNSSSRRLVINFSIPLIFGGIFSLLLLEKEIYGLIAPVTLLFYGLACLNASKYTLRDVRSLGITMMILGLFATYFIGYGLYFWAIGFGVCHIIYGSIMYFKYDRD